MRHEIKKYTLDDMRYIDKILEAFCDKKTKHKTILKGKHTEIDFGKVRISQKKIEAFKLEGFEVIEIEDYEYTKKEMISGIPVEITALKKNTKDYKAKGIQIHITCSGETRKALEKDIDYKERVLINYLNKYGIPLDRLCIESSLQCEHKFSGNACVSVN